MNKNLKVILIFLGYGIPYILIYRVFFQSGSLTFGDAPFFAPENLKELFNFPFTWNFRHDNFGASQFYILWLYVPTYLYGFLNHTLGLGNDFLTRIIFYFPATILAIIGSWKFIDRFNQNIYGKFLGSFLYGFNTYFLMLTDGGQVGIALAYGLFPLVVLSIVNYFLEFNLRNYIFSVTVIFILFSTDARIGFIAVLLGFLIWFIITSIKKWDKLLFNFFLLGTAILGLSLFWVFPALLNFSSERFLNIGTNNNFISLINSFFLFQPHFPLNQFGRLSPTPFYFCFFILLIFGNLFFLSKFKQSGHQLILKLSLLFLLFVFIAKGGNEPLGGLYLWMIDHTPWGIAFRDASKFYIPLILIGGLLLSFTMNGLNRIIKNKTIWHLAILGIYVYLLALIYPALLGHLSGVLGQPNKLKDFDYQQIFKNLSQKQGFFRSLYIEEKPAKFYGTFAKPVISANTLYQERPFASMIVGKYDLYNFLHNPYFYQWFNLLGIKYVFLPENERKKNWSFKEQEERTEFLNFVDTVPGLQRLDWQTTFPVYQISTQTTPHIFGVKKAYFIIGSEEVYQSFFQLPNFSLKNQGFVFLEEGKVNLNNLKNLDPKSLVLIFFNKELIDLQMGYFITSMISPSQAIENQWKIYNSNDYLIWKYELLKQGVETKEFDYGKGVAISTIPKEKINFKIQTPYSGKYFLAIRFTSTSNGELKLTVKEREYKLKNKNPPSFKWEILGPINADKSNIEIVIANDGDFALLNTLALLSEDQFRVAEQHVKDLTANYKTIFLRSDMANLKDMKNMGEENIIAIDYKQINPTLYQLTKLPQYPMWIVFSDHYNTGWVLNDQSSVHLPFYAMINGFYVEKPPKDDTLFFVPQKTISRDIFLSIISFGIITLTIIFILIRMGKAR